MGSLKIVLFLGVVSSAAVISTEAGKHFEKRDVSCDDYTGYGQYSWQEGCVVYNCLCNDDGVCQEIPVLGCGGGGYGGYPPNYYQDNGYGREGTRRGRIYMRQGQSMRSAAKEHCCGSPYYGDMYQYDPRSMI